MVRIVWLHLLQDDESRGDVNAFLQKLGRYYAAHTGMFHRTSVFFWIQMVYHYTKLDEREKVASASFVDKCSFD